MNVRINQAGSIANFIVIGVVLVVLTAGVIYAVRQKDAPAPRETPVVTQPEKTADSPKKEDKPVADEPEAAPAPAPTPVAETPAVASAPTVATISQTGPADTTVQLIAIGAIAVASIGFVRSRSLRSSL